MDCGKRNCLGTPKNFPKVTKVVPVKIVVLWFQTTLGATARIQNFVTLDFGLPSKGSKDNNRNQGQPEELLKWKHR